MPVRPSPRAVLPALVLLLIGSSALAGTVMKFEEKGADGSTPTSGTAWIEKDRLKVETGRDSVVFRADEGVLRQWTAGETTYVEMTKAQADAMGAAMAEMQKQMAGMSPEERAMMQQVMGSRMGSVSAQAAAGAKPAAAPLVFRPLGRSETINGWSCAGHEARRGGELAGEYWTAGWDQFGITAQDFAVFEKLMLFIKEVVGPFGSMMDGAYAPYGENGLPGVPVRVVTDGPNGRRVHEITKLTHEDIPAAAFEVPAGRTKQDAGARGRR